jgi:predicted AAA+ superfamily ATPase
MDTPLALGTNGRPSVIGLYGISGSGKSYFLKFLEMELDKDMFVFFEGSDVLAKLVPGGLNAFKKLVDDEKARYRTDAIQHVQLVCRVEKKIGLLAGH